MALVLHLPFVTVAASSTPDISGGGHDGVLVPGSGTGPLAAHGPTPGLPGLRTPVVSSAPSYVSCPVGSAPTGDAMTVAMWVKFATYNARNALWSITNASTPGTPAPFIELNGTNIQWNMPGYFCNAAPLPAGLVMTVWHHYAWSRAGVGQNQAYVDSVALTTSSSNDAVAASTYGTFIGVRYEAWVGAQLGSDATFADVMVYDEALTPAQIRALFCKALNQDALAFVGH